LFRIFNPVKSGWKEACFVFLITPWNYILFVGESKNGGCNEAIKNCTVGEHPAVLANNNLLANKSIYWPSPKLASKSEQRPLTSYPPKPKFILVQEAHQQLRKRVLDPELEERRDRHAQ
jgi:hypothetical protein